MHITIQEITSAPISNPRNLVGCPTDGHLIARVDQPSAEMDVIFRALAEEMGPISKNYYNGCGFIERAPKTYAAGTGSGTITLEHYVTIIPINAAGELTSTTEPYHLGGFCIKDGDEESLNTVLSFLEEQFQEKNIDCNIVRESDSFRPPR